MNGIYAGNPHVGLPITDDDASITAMLEDVSIPTLMLSMVHMTGDASWIRGPIRPLGLFLNEIQGYLPDDQKAEIRARAFDEIVAFRDAGCVLPPPPDEALLREMMAWLVCEEVPAEYVPMMLEDMELDGTDQRSVVSHSSTEARAALPVVVVGATGAELGAGVACWSKRNCRS